MRAYDEEYLFDAMEVLGEAFDCAANRAGLTLDQFFEMFIATGVADAFGIGAPRYVSGSSGIELVLDVCYRAGLDVAVALADMPGGGDTPEYWCGWAVAYWQWGTGRPFRSIARMTSMEEVLGLYHPLHEAAEQRFVEVMEERVRRRGAPLKSWREQRGLSQAALAERSGVSLRAIQQYEQRYKDINHSRGASLYRLAQALGCRVEDLFEYPV